MADKAVSSKGGRTTVERYGQQTMAEIGKKGGESTAAKYGTEHYQSIGRKGGKKVRELIQRGREDERRRERRPEDGESGGDSLP